MNKNLCVILRNVIIINVVKTGCNLTLLYLWRLAHVARDNKNTFLCSAWAHHEEYHLRSLSQQNRAALAKHEEVTTWKRTVTGNRADFLPHRKRGGREAEKKAWNAEPQRYEPSGHRKFSFRPLLQPSPPPPESLCLATGTNPWCHTIFIKWKQCSLCRVTAETELHD